MTHLKTSIPLFVAMSMLAACGGGGADGGSVRDEPTPPSIDSSDVRSAEIFIANVNARRDTPAISILPGGTATYTGKMVTGLSINEETSVDGLIGDVRLTAQLFTAGDAVSGSVSNIHTLDGDSPVERLSGELAISGELDDGTKIMTSALTGQLSGLLGDGERGDLNVSGTMNGRTQDTLVSTTTPNPFPILPPLPIPIYDEATGIAGAVSGNISGSEAGSFSGTWAVSE